MIEVKNIKLINKGALVATCDVKLVDKKLTLREIKVFEKYPNKWISMPCKEFVNELQEKKYIELAVFDDESTKSKFRDEVIEVIDAFIKTNESNPVEQKNEQFPF